MTRAATILWLSLTALLICAAPRTNLLAQVPRPSVGTGEPDYSVWNAILSRHYDERRGMNYRALKARDLRALQELRQRLSQVNVASLTRDEQLAFWINLYNVNVVATIAEKYPVKSIRALSTDPVIRLNVFKRALVPFGSGKISLNAVENEKIRKQFRDPRIHFAINCAAASCPPIRETAFTGAGLQQQLDDQTRRFLNGPNGVRITRDGKTTVVHVTKIMHWFGEDFEQVPGGRPGFIRRYVSQDKRQLIDSAGTRIRIAYDDYNWDLNDAR